MRYTTVMSTFVVLAAALPASAQVDEERVNFTLGAGYTFSSGEVRDHLGDGYNINIGLTVNVNPIVGLESLYSFNGLGEKQLSLPVSATPFDGTATVPSDFFADMNMQYFTENVVLRPQVQSKVKPFFLIGAGVYYRPVKVTTPSVGYVPGYCDPFWYVCSAGGFVPTDRIIGDRSSTDFGMDFGAGMNFDVSEGASLFFEVRYHYIWGPTIEPEVTTLPSATSTSTSSSLKANGQFVPLTFGIRF